MVTHEKYTLKKCHFKGALTLNTRSVIDSLTLVSNFENRNKTIYKTPLYMEELSNFIHFLEAIIMGNKMYYDGTVPEKFVNQILEQSDYVSKELAVSRRKEIDLFPIQVDSSKTLLSKCKEAMEQSSEVIRETDFRALIKEKSENPIKKMENVETFFAYIDRDYSSKKIRKEIAQEIASQKKFQGSKCIIGLLLAEKTSVDLLEHVQQWASKVTDSISRQYFMAALINRFRVNYINALSQIKQSAYMADTRVEGIQNYQVFLLWKYLAQRISQERKINPEKVPDTFRTDFEKMPIGYAFFLNSKSNNPVDLIAEAIERRNSLSIKYDSKISSNRYIHTFSEDELGAFQDDLFGAYYDKLVVNYEPFKQSKITKYVIPPLLGQVSKAAAKQIIAAYSETELSQMGEILVNVFGSVVQSAVNNADPKAKAKAYVTNIRNWKNEYTDAIVAHDLSARLQNRVNDVFMKDLSL